MGKAFLLSLFTLFGVLCILSGKSVLAQEEFTYDTRGMEIMDIILSFLPKESHQVTEQCVLNGEGPGIFTPIGAARAYKLVAEAMFNSWSRYTKRVLPTVATRNVPRVTPNDSDTFEEDKLKAITYAGFLIIQYLLPERTTLENIPDLLQERYDVDVSQINGNKALTRILLNSRRKSPEYIAAVLTLRLIIKAKNDGSNQEGCYSDISNYYSTNPPTILDNFTSVENAALTNRGKYAWSPEIKTGYINRARPFLTPHAGRIDTFAVSPGRGPFRAAPLPVDNATAMHNFFLELVEVQARLPDDNDYLKLVAEFWADGPKSTLPPGHWMEITEFVLQTKNSSLDDTIVTMFVVAQSILDSGIVCWADKRYYNSVRPSTYIPCFVNKTDLPNGEELFSRQFRGSYCPFGAIEPYEWQPYQLPIFITPSFPEYTSGHSSFSAGAAGILTRWFGDENFPVEYSFTYKKGKSFFEPHCFENETDLYGDPCEYQECGADNAFNSANWYSPPEDVTLGPFKTYLDAAISAGLSRLYGGIHIMPAAVEGWRIGDAVSEKVYQRATRAFIFADHPAGEGNY